MQKFTNMTEIKRGFSSDRKFCVADTRGCKYFLRISALENAERKATEFEQAKAIQRLGIPMCTPLDFEIRDDGVYSLYSWIDGEDARTALRHFSLKNQYDYGAKAGLYCTLFPRLWTRLNGRHDTIQSLMSSSKNTRPVRINIKTAICLSIMSFQIATF